MKFVTFIRHYKLAPPLDKKETVTHDDFVTLSKGESDPSIHTDVRDYCLKELDKQKYLSFDYIFSSPTKRTMESAKAIKEVFNLKAQIEINNFLKECIWNPDLPGERINRFINGTELSNLKDTWERIKNLDNFLRNISYDNILCVTHSFFMQIIYLYYFCGFKNHSEIKPDDIKSSFHGRYLEGFDVEI